MLPVRGWIAGILIGGHQVDHLLGHWGYGFVFTIVAVQSAGVPLPGTTAVIAAAIYAGTTHHLAITGVIAAAALGAGLGNLTGFALGWWGGWELLRRYGQGVGLTPARLKVGRYVFNRHGGKVVFFGRFITGLRTWSGFLAGANRMSPPRFVVFSSLAAIVWAVTTSLQYYYFGHLLDVASTGVGIALVLVGIALTVIGVMYLRRRGRSLLLAAELAHPEPLD